tara:strand:- start:1480 stop:1665 length:186 start_codon:yes stop_codon:yes gene_type:complete
MNMIESIKSLFRDESGATAIEYGLILALIAMAMITGLQTFADATIGMWERVETDVREAQSN